MNRYSGDICLSPGISRLGLGCKWPWNGMDNPGLSHVQTSPVQPNAASCTKYSKMCCLLAQLLIFSCGEAASGGGGSPPSPSRQPPLHPWTDVTIAAAISTAQSRRRRLDAPTKFECQWGHGVATPLAPLQPNTTSWYWDSISCNSLQWSGCRVP